MKKLYKAYFNDFGEAYVLAESFGEAEEKIKKESKTVIRIKRIVFLAEEKSTNKVWVEIIF